MDIGSQIWKKNSKGFDQVGLDNNVCKLNGLFLIENKHVGMKFLVHGIMTHVPMGKGGLHYRSSIQHYLLTHLVVYYWHGDQGRQIET
jgi:hypothetical protein